MNIKLHTPKSLKAGSGLSTVKQFVLSLIATSISIALTLGTAAIIDYQAKQKAKREIERELRREKKAKERAERREYERLKKKYEGS